MTYRGEISNNNIRIRRRRFVKIVAPRVAGMFYTLGKMRLLHLSKGHSSWQDVIDRHRHIRDYLKDYAERNIPKQGWFIG